MRRIHAWPILFVATVWPTTWARAQPPSTDDVPNPGSRCFRIEARSEVPGRGQRVEFILSPAAGGRDDLQTWELRGPIRGDRAALWWRNGDRLAAVMIGDDGELWHLDIDPPEEVMEGRMRRTLPTPGDTAAFRAVPEECV